MLSQEFLQYTLLSHGGLVQGAHQRVKVGCLGVVRCSPDLLVLKNWDSIVSNERLQICFACSFQSCIVLSSGIEASFLGSY